MRILTVSVLCLLSFVLPAAETNDLAISRQALRDGLWEVARAHAGATTNDLSRLVVLESMAGEGNWKEISRLLGEWKDARGEGFDYYRAVARGDHAAAMAILRKGGSREGVIEADLFEADELAKTGNREAAEKIWRGIAADTNASKRAFALASVNLMDVTLLRRAYSEADSVALRRLTGLRLGVALLKDAKAFDEGERLVRRLVKDSPDADGAKEAFLSLADAQISNGRWKEAHEAYHEAIETWPDTGRRSDVQEGRGWALVNLARREDALEAFQRAGELASDDETRARVAVKVGDILQELERSDEAIAAYRAVLDKYPNTDVAKRLQSVVAIRELEKRGRELYRNLDFAEAAKVFEEVGKADAARAPMMSFYAVLCLYGQGRDDEACAQARKLTVSCPSPALRLESTLWLAKFLYNRREWEESGRLFADYAKAQADAARAADALLWAARAAFAEENFSRAIQLAAQVVESYPETKAKPRALLVQGEALVELARFDEAVLVLDRVSVSESVSSDDRVRAQVLKADALYAMGSDNPVRYEAALDAYRSVDFGGKVSPGEKIVLAYKTARTLEKLKRLDEATDLYYAQVILAYRSARLAGQRLTDEARAAFSRAAFRLADEYESRGREAQAVSVLRLVVESDVPAADEAAKRIDRIYNKGRML